MPYEGLLRAEWEAPANINALVTTKENHGESFLQELPVQFLKQVHGNQVLHLESHAATEQMPEADAIYTRLSQVVCAIRTADCLPVFFSSADGNEIAVAHAGWRGLAAGILENTVACFQAEAAGLLVSFGPAIGPCHFEVGTEVREAFLDAAADSDKEATARAFEPGRKTEKWQADLYKLARLRLQAVGVGANNISGSAGAPCSYCDAERLYSYRRDGKSDGRMLSLIWR